MIRIGEFSKLAQVPIATLRYYDQVGLFRPEQVDELTGYRYYTLNQLPRLNRILALKGLGFSLEQIARVLEEGLTPDQMRGMLRLRQAEISQQLAEMQGRLVEVEARLRQIEREAQLPGYDVVLKQVEPRLVASVRSILPTRAAVGELFAEIYRELGEQATAVLGLNPGENGQSLVVWYDQEYKDTGFDGAAAFFARSRVPDRGRMRVHELPAILAATTIHHGTYESIGDAHQAVISWIEDNRYRICGADREINLYNRAPIRRDNPTYITEIQYPVEKLKGE